MKPGAANSHLFRIVLAIVMSAFLPLSAGGEQKTTMIEKVWASLEGEPFLTFQRARERFLAEDYEDAGRSVRKGAAFLILETERANLAHKEKLEVAVTGLTKVAEQVEKELIANGKRLDMAFAQAHLALASHYGSISQKYESLGEIQEALRAMDISAGHLLAANHWSPEGLEEDDVAGLRKSRAVLEKVEEGTGDAKKALGNAFKKLSKGMERMSKYVRFYEGEPPTP